MTALARRLPEVAPESLDVGHLVAELSRMSALLASLQRPTAAPPSVTVEAIWHEYRAARASTMRSWRTAVQARIGHVLAFFGHRPAASLTFADVDAYRAKRSQDLTRSRRPTMPGTRNRELCLLRAMLTFAVERGHLNANPLARIQLEREDNARCVVLGEAEIARLLTECSPHLRALVLVVYDSGMRRGEAGALTWSQLDFDAGLITLYPQQTKTRKGRVVHLSDRAAAALQALPRAGGLVFTNPETGRPFDYYGLYTSFARAAKRAGLKGPAGERVWLHDLRRSWITNARRRGIPESTIMAMSGHASNQVFRRYSINSLADVHAARAVLEAARQKEGGRS